MPRYAFRCPTCGLAFDVERPMRQAGDAAACPADGAAAERVFTVPGLSLGVASPPPSPPSAGRRYWSSPFFPTDRTVSPEAAPAPRHVLPPESSKPTSFRHFGHWHPAGTPAHTHRARKRAAPAPGR